MVTSMLVGAIKGATIGAVTGALMGAATGAISEGIRTGTWEGAFKGMLFGAEGYNFDRTPRYPSRFVLDIDENLLQYVNKPADGLIANAREFVEYGRKYMPENLQSVLLQAGTRVRSEYLGEGTVIDIDFDKNSYSIKFDGVETPRMISFLAKLTVL